LDVGVDSATPSVLSDFVKASKSILFDADGLVFKEAASKLIGSDGKGVTKS
jgi:hypothetical protein